MQRKNQEINVLRNVQSVVRLILDLQEIQIVENSAEVLLLS